MNDIYDYKIPKKYVHYPFKSVFFSSIVVESYKAYSWTYDYGVHRVLRIIEVNPSGRIQSELTIAVCWFIFSLSLTHFVCRIALISILIPTLVMRTAFAFLRVYFTHVVGIMILNILFSSQTCAKICLLWNPQIQLIKFISTRKVHNNPYMC